MNFETWQSLYGDQPTQHSVRVRDWLVNLECVCRQTTVHDWSGFGFVSQFRLPPMLIMREIDFDLCREPIMVDYAYLHEIDRWTWRERVITNDPFRPQSRYL